MTVLITSLNTVKITPFTKKSITITGSNFGTDKTKIQAYLQNKLDLSKKIALKVESITNTQLVVRFPGARIGNYDLVVYRIGWGISKPTTKVTDDDFEVSIKMTGVSPLEGSIGGGTLITITGENFDPSEYSTLVNIGETPN